MRVSRESYLLMAICFADLASTIYLVSYQSACEGNPLMAYYLRQGTGMFILMKSALCVLPIFIAEYARRYRPRLVRISMRSVIAAYLITYLGGIAILNSNILDIISDRVHGYDPVQMSLVHKNKQPRATEIPQQTASTAWEVKAVPASL